MKALRAMTAVLGMAATALVGIGGQASAATEVTLDGGLSGAPLSLIVAGASSAGVLLQSSSSNSAAPGTASLIPSGGPAVTLPAPLNGKDDSRLVGTFAVNWRYGPNRVGFVDTTNLSRTGIVSLGANESFQGAGPNGWVTYDTVTGKIDYVQPTGTGDEAAVTRRTLVTFPGAPRSGANFSVRTNTTGALVASNCSPAACGGSSTLRFYPFDAGTPSTTLHDSSAAWSTPVLATSTSPGPVSAVSCPSSTMCAAVDGYGAIITTTNPAGGASAWTATEFPVGVSWSTISCPTTTLCVAAQTDGSVRTSTNPTGGAAAWSAPVATGGRYLNTLSCPTTTLCVGFDFMATMVISTNPTGGASAWSTASGADVAQLSCPSASLCAGVDYFGNVYASTSPLVAASWVTIPLGSNFLKDIACPTTTFCLAVDANGLVFSSTAPTSTWSSGSSLTSGLASVSCVSSTECVLIDGGTGTAWRSSTTPSSVGSYTSAAAATAEDDLRTLECVSTLCVAGGYRGGLAPSTTSGQTWGAVDQITTNTQNGWASVSCPAATTTCVAVDYGGKLLVSTDGGGTWGTPYSLPNGVVQITCATATACVAVDYNGTALNSSNPAGGAGTWTNSTGTSSPGFSALSCPSTSLCVALDYNGNVVTSANAFGSSPSWAAQPGILTSAGSVACASASFCVIGDGDGHVRTSSTPTSAASWTAPVRATTERGFRSMSCPSSTLCVGATNFGTTLVTTTPSVASWSTARVEGAYLSQLSCPSTTLCIGVDGDGTVAMTTTPASTSSAWQLGNRTGSGVFACNSTTSCFAGANDGTASVTHDPLGSLRRDTTQLAVNDAGAALWSFGNGPRQTTSRITTSSVTPVGNLTPDTCATDYVLTAARTGWVDACALNFAVRWIAADGTGGVQTVSGSYDFGLSSDGTSMWMTRSDSVADNGFYQLPDTATTVTKVPGTGGIATVGADALALGPGRVLYSDNDPAGVGPDGDLGLWSRTVTAAPSNLTVGSPSRVATTSFSFSLDTSGRRVLTQSASTGGLVLLGDGAAITLPAVDLYGHREPRAARLSGHRVLYDNGDRAFALFDERTGSNSTVVGSGEWALASLSGRYIVALTNTASVVRRDLTSGTTTTIAPAPTLATGEALDLYDADVDSAGTGAAWRYTVTNGSNRVSRGGYVSSLAGPVHDITFDGSAAQRVKISGEYVVHTSSGASALTAIRLADGATSTVPATLPAPTSYSRLRPLAVDGDVVGYVGSDGYAHLSQLPATGTNVPHVLTAWTAANATVGSPWRGDVVTSAALTSCSFTISSGATNVRTLPCNASEMAMGEADVSWDGKNAAGVQQPAGSYTWTLSAAGADGALLRDDLTAGALSGPITLSPAAVVSSLVPPASTTAPWSVKFSRDVFKASTVNVKLLSSTGSAIAASMSCLSSTGVSASCAGPARSVRITPSTALTPGATYRLVVNPTGVTTRLTDIAGAPVTSYASALTRVKTADDLGMSEAWATTSDTTAVGKSYVSERRAGASLTATFSGTGVKLWYVTRPDAGRVEVRIDGVVKTAALEQYSSTKRTKVSKVYTGLAAGTHTLVVRVLGTKAAASTGTLGTVDAISTATATCVTTTGCTVSPGGQRWATVAVTGALGGRMAVSDVSGASLTRTFFGVGLDLYRQVGPTQGQMSVYVDGVLVATVNNYAAASGVTRFTRTGLANKLHTLKVVVLHKAGKVGTTAYAVTLDRLVAR